MYPDALDQKTVQLVLFGILHAKLSDAAKLHGLAAPDQELGPVGAVDRAGGLGEQLVIGGGDHPSIVLGLLRQPHGFEGFPAVHVLNHAGRLVVAER